MYDRNDGRFALFFYALAAASTAAKFLIALTCHRFDMESWNQISLIYLMGENVYENTLLYNYGPPWFLMLGALRKIHFFYGFPGGPEGFHALIALFLSAFDVGIALILKKLISARVSMLFLLNPISIFVTGFLVQFDQVAIFFALLSVCFLNESRKDYRSQFIGSALLGLSLVIKHSFIFFPIWLFFHYLIEGKRRLLTLLYVVMIPYLMFLIFPMFWLRSEKAQKGYEYAVMNFSSNYLNAPVPKMLDLIGALDYIEKIVILPGTLYGYKILWLSMIILLGWIFRRRSIQEKLLLYGLSVVALSPSIWGQYHVICLFYVIANFDHLFSRLFLFASFCYHLLAYLNTFTFEYGISRVPEISRYILENHLLPYVPVYFLIPLLFSELFLRKSESRMVFKKSN